MFTSLALPLFIVLGFTAQSSELSPAWTTSLETGHAIDVDYSYYHVAGATARSIFRSMHEHSPQDAEGRYFGITTWQTTLQYTAMDSRGGCRLTDVGVSTDVVITLPQWTTRSASSHELRNAWDVFLLSLAKHERGHEHIARRQSVAIYDALTSFRTSDPCEGIDRRAKALVDDTSEQFDRLNRQYDVESDHGRMQGAVWPPENWSERD